MLPALLLVAPLVAASLSTDCAPGGNFNLSIWDLQLPIGSTGDPTTISSPNLEGCSGYTNPDYFYTECCYGALVMNVPGSPSTSGCVTTANSLHCRTEFREISPSSWNPNATTNRLSATLAVLQPDESTHGTVIGQVHIDDSVSSKPVCELYYNSLGNITMGVEQSLSGGDEVYTTIATVPKGIVFTYKIAYEQNVLSVSINGGTATILSTYSLNAPPSYFKAGNYNQGNNPSSVYFFAISVSH